MKKLNKKFQSEENTLERYTRCYCDGSECLCYCAPGTQWANLQSQHFGNAVNHVFRSLN